MAVSRPVLLALLGAVLLAATFMATRNTATDDAGTNVTAPAKPAKTDAAANKPSTTKSQPDEKPARDKAPARERERAEKAPARKPALPRTGSANGVPLAVSEALADREVVVLLFSQRGADDAATRAAVRSLRGEKGVAVFTEDLKHLASYRRIVEGLGVSQAPSVVIVGHDLRARLVEGFVDEGSLRQHVRDVR
jgi:hypothetical protein